MTSPIPLISTSQEKPTYPLINLQLVPQGLVVNIQLGPTTTITQLIQAEAMDQVAKQWRESRKNTDDILRAVQLSKI